MLKFPPLKPGDRINRTWFNRLIDHVNSLYLSGDGITTRVSHGSAGTVVSAVPQIAEAAGGAFRNFAMSPDAAGTGIIIGEGCYYLESNGVRNLYRQAPSAVTSANMPPADGKIYYYCLGMRGAPPWIGGTNSAFPGWNGTIGGISPAGLTPVVIGAVKMTTPVQVFQPPALGIPVIPALPSEDFAVYAEYAGATFSQNYHSSFAAIPFKQIHVNGGWVSNATYYQGTSVPPKDPWERSGWTYFDAEDFEGSRMMIAVRFGPDGYTTIITQAVGSTAFTGYAWDYQAKRAIFPLARVSYYPSGAGLKIEQVHTGAVYAAPLYDPTE